MMCLNFDQFAMNNEHNLNFQLNKILPTPYLSALSGINRLEVAWLALSTMTINTTTCSLRAAN